MYKPIKIDELGGAYSVSRTSTHYYFHLSFPHKENEKVIVLAKANTSIRIVSKGDKDGKMSVIVEMRMMLFKGEKSALKYLKENLITCKVDKDVYDAY